MALIFLVKMSRAADSTDLGIHGEVLIKHNPKALA